MTQQEVISEISNNIAGLKEYNSKAKSRMGNLMFREQDIQKGSQLLSNIQRGPLFEDEDGRDPEYESSMGEDVFKELRNELSKTSCLVHLLKGDISEKVYEDSIAPSL